MCKVLQPFYISRDGCAKRKDNRSHALSRRRLRKQCVLFPLQKLWQEGPKRALSGLLRRGSSSSASAASMPQLLDESLIRQLAPLAATCHAYKLEKEVTDGDLVSGAGSPCPSPGNAGPSTLVSNSLDTITTE